MNIIDLLSRYLKKFKYSGGNWASAICPFHSEKRPSFGISVETGFFHCFACGAKGPLQVLLNKLGLWHIDISKLELRGVRRKWTKTPTLPEYVLKAYRVGLPKKLLQAGFRREILRSYELRFDSYELRIIFPVRDINGKLVAISGRTVLDELPRYKFYDFDIEGYELRPHQYLFGIDKIRATAEIGLLDFIVVCEGFKAAIWLSQNGYPAVALMGTFITSSQINQLQYFYKPVYLFMDKDEAGSKAELVIARKLVGKVPAIYFCNYPSGGYQQPDDLDKVALERAFSEKTLLTKRR